LAVSASLWAVGDVPGEFPPKDSNGVSYLKIPLNAL